NLSSVDTKVIQVAAGRGWVTDTPPTDRPKAALAADLDGSHITDTPRDVFGTVTSPGGSLVAWGLEIQQLDGTWVSLATGTTAQTGTPRLGVVDPTTFDNGSYRVRLTAYDRGGVASSDEAQVTIDSGVLKMGKMTLSYTDLSLKVGGIPISVVRT